MRGIVPVLALAAVSAGLAQRPAPVPDLLARLASPRFATRRDAVRACARRQEPRLLAALVRVARADRHPNIRAWAVEALGEHRDRSYLEFFRQRFALEDNPFPKGRSLVALAKLRRPEHRSLFEQVLAQQYALAVAAAQALAELGDPRSFDVVRDVCEKHPHRDRSTLQQVLAGTLLRLDPKRATDYLLAVWRDPTRASRRSSIAGAFRQAPSPRIRDAMLGELEHEDEQRRRWALFVLGKAGDAKAAKRIMVFFEIEDALRPECVVALREIAAPGSAAYLASFLAGEKQVHVRRAIARALRELGDPRAAERVHAALLEEEDTLAKVEMLATLGELGDQRAAAGIIRFVDDGEIQAQNPRLSRIRGFPWNVRVGDVALWALLCLRDGEEPVPLARLGRFPVRRGVDAWARREASRIKTWWSELERRAPWRFESGK